MADFFSMLADTLDPPAPKGWKWNPTPKQQEAVEASAEAFETLYGGAAGGGKSFAMANMAVDYALRHPKSQVGIFRKTRENLRKTHVRMLRPMLSGIAKHNATLLTWDFHNGSVIRLLSMPHTGAEEKYQGDEYDFLFFDEVTEITEEQYDHLLTRMRSIGGYRTGVFVSANPWGVGYKWVKDRWVTGKTPGELWYPTLSSGKPGRPRVYIPAALHDNPHLMEADPDYLTSLEGIKDPRKRAALLYGDWDAMSQVPGALWDLDTIETHRVTALPQLDRVVIGVDPAVTYGDNSDLTGIVAVGIQGRDLYVLSDHSLKASPAGWAAEVLKAAAIYGTTEIVAEANQGGDMVKHTITEAARVNRQTVRVRLVRATKGKALRAEPIAAMYELGMAHHYRTLAELERELTEWTPESPKSPDRLDAMVWAATYLTQRGGGQYSNY